MCFMACLLPAVSLFYYSRGMEVLSDVRLSLFVHVSMFRLVPSVYYKLIFLEFLCCSCALPLN